MVRTLAPVVKQRRNALDTQPRDDDRRQRQTRERVARGPTPDRRPEPADGDENAAEEGVVEPRPGGQHADAERGPAAHAIIAPVAGRAAVARASSTPTPATRHEGRAVPAYPERDEDRERHLVEHIEEV